MIFLRVFTYNGRFPFGFSFKFLFLFLVILFFVVSGSHSSAVCTLCCGQFDLFHCPCSSSIINIIIIHSK